jgi:hypothetical protein
MKLAEAIACGAAALGFAAGSALAGEGDFAMNDDGSQDETYILLEPVDVTQAYGVDEDRDGVIDRYLYLEESDSLG